MIPQFRARVSHARADKRGRRGLSLVEVLAATCIGLIIMAMTTSFNAMSGKLFLGCTGGAGAQHQAERALQIMAADLRAARGIAAGTSLDGTPPTLVLQMPAYNTDGTLAIPVHNGNTVTYSVSTNGRMLIRNESGVGSKNVAVVDQYGSISFAIGYTTRDTNNNGIIELNEYVTLIPSLSVTNKLSAGSSVYDRTFSSSQEIVLRNR